MLLKKKNISQFGNTLGLYYAWQEDTSDYIGFSLDDKIPDVDSNELTELLNQSNQIIVVRKQQLSKGNLRGEYRRKYYEHDFNVLS